MPTSRPWTSWAAPGCWNVNGKGAYPSWSRSEMSTVWLRGHLPPSISTAWVSRRRTHCWKYESVTWKKCLMIFKVGLWLWAYFISFKDKLTRLWIMISFNHLRNHLHTSVCRLNGYKWKSSVSCIYIQSWKELWYQLKLKVQKCSCKSFYYFFTFWLRC